MKYPTMRFVFDRKKVATKTHKGLVQIEVLSEGKRKWIGTGVKVYSDQWNDRKKIINSVEMIQLNQCLDEQLRIIQNWINELMIFFAGVALLFVIYRSLFSPGRVRI